MKEIQYLLERVFDGPRGVEYRVSIWGTSGEWVPMQVFSSQEAAKKFISNYTAAIKNRNICQLPTVDFDTLKVS